MAGCVDLGDCLLSVDMICYLPFTILFRGLRMSITTKCQVLEVGKVRRDAGALFGELPFDDWNKNFINGEKAADKVPESMPIGRDRRVVLPANVLSIRTESDHILIDTGTPVVHEDHTAVDWSGSRLRLQLRTVCASLKDISKVVLTSFEIDHAGGLTHLDRTGKLVYSFPHAEVFYHASDKQRQRPHTIADADVAAEMMVNHSHHPCWEATEVAPGITLHPIVGPSVRGCVVEVTRGAERLLYLGDLCPTVYHVNGSTIPAFDDNPEATYAERRHWLELAINGGYKVVFGHGAKIKTGWIERTKRGLEIKPAE